MKASNNQFHEYKIKPMELNLHECFWDLIEQWKAVLVVALICSVLASAVLGYRANTRAAEESVKPQSKEEVIASLSESDMREVSYVMDLQRKYYELSDYLSDSALMHLDPNQANCLKCEWQIKADQSSISVLIDEYKSHLLTDESLEQIAEAVNADMGLPYFKELFTCNHSLSETKEDTQENNATFQVKVFLPANMDAEVMETNVLAAVERVHNDLNNQIIAHQCNLAFSKKETSVDTDLYTLQYNRQAGLMSLRSNYNASIQQLSPGQKTAFDQLVAFNNEPDQAVAKIDTVAETKGSWFNLTYGIIGFICGIVLYAILLVLGRILLRKTMSADMIRDRVGLKKVGEIYPGSYEGAKTGLFRSRHLYTLHHKGKIDSKKQIDRSLQAIQLQCNKESMREIYALLLNDLNKAELEVMEQIREELKNADITLTVVNQDEYNQLQDDLFEEQRKSVLLVANHGARERSLESLLDMLNQLETPIYGYIYMG